MTTEEGRIPESVLRKTTVIPYQGSAYDSPNGDSYLYESASIDLANDVDQPHPNPAGAHGPRCMCAKISSAEEPLPLSTLSAVAESRPVHTIVAEALEALGPNVSNILAAY